MHEDETELWIALAGCEQVAAVEGERFGPLESPRLKMLSAPHQQRRPAQLMAGRQRLHAERMARRRDLQCNEPRNDQVEIRAIVAFAEDHLVPIEPHACGE